MSTIQADIAAATAAAAARKYFIIIYFLNVALIVCWRTVCCFFCCIVSTGRNICVCKYRERCQKRLLFYCSIAESPNRTYINSVRCTKHHLSQSYCNMCKAFHNVWTLIAGFDVNQMTKCETASESAETHAHTHTHPCNDSQWQNRKSSSALNEITELAAVA